MGLLTKEQAAAFRQELDRLQSEVQAQLGEDDRDHIESIALLARLLEVAGRLLIHASLDPISWSLGVVSLAAQKTLSTTELGHNILHAQYNFLGDPRFEAQSYQWDFAADEGQWRREHNTQHHRYTNIVGKDPDLTYSTYRMHDLEAWRPWHRAQPVVVALSYALFDCAIGLYVSGVLDRELAPSAPLVLGDRTLAEARQAQRAFLAKAAKLALRDLLVFPALAGAQSPKVILGNLLATLLRNVFVGAVVYCGHFTDGMTVFTQAETEGETKGEAAVRQILAAGNFEAGRVLSTLAGHLNYQIEHHLFPTLPAWRYPAMARRLRPLCEKYGIPYNTGSFGAQFSSVVRRVLRYARRPARANEAATASPAAA